jgi:GTP-binding protein HflX
VALVGYTNAGKSTLLNQLTDANVLVADQLLATLDPTTRRIDLPGGQQALVTDTVGFIQKLPTMLVAAFRATLEEIVEADLLLHVVDITHAQYQAQAEAVRETLEEIGAIQIPSVTALNKIDLLTNQETAYAAVDDFDRAVPVSARTGEGVPALLATLEQVLAESLVRVSVRIPYAQGKLINHFHEVCQVDSVEHEAEYVQLRGRAPAQFAADFDRFAVEPGSPPPATQASSPD